MRFYYGNKSINRVLDEMEFWKRQEAEHTVVIRKIVTDLEHPFQEKLEDLENEFSKIEERTVEYIQVLNRSGYSPTIYQEIMNLVNFALLQSEHFVVFLNKIINESQAVKNNRPAIIVINHIQRESEYFIGIARTILENYCYW
ncbi:DUF2935 domain-containing protein [Thermohalobacter berrensis]|uniref:DUF2935 domain-containing protein n=1 Tax=Thermohalobacter berrensis TaxID=99594 RepID=A0A419SWI8_9FIRM|nr:DUF2935 domain-containing protein [Thermohalobacter berrensis]RKD29572.1 hypothetical protein BET03_05800 [Thermohalobacter berrensis]